MPSARLARTHGDWALAVGLAALLQAELWTVGPDPHGDAAGGAGAYPRDQRVAAAVALAFALSLAWRRRAPLLVLAGSVGFALAARWLPVLDAPTSGALATVVAAYSAGAHTAARRAVAGAAGVAAVVAATAVPGSSAGDVAFIAMIVGGAWLAGRAMRHRRERESVLRGVALELEREREARARAAVAEERVRIARELHDVVAHGISVMVLQARGARRSLDADPDAVREALDGIESTGSGALAEMRRLVGMLRHDDEEIAFAPRPSLRHVEALAGQMREAGLRVELSVEGRPGAVPPGIDLAAYRIVQEALTNTLKHAGQVTARVNIRYEHDGVEVEVSDTGRAVAGDGSGHGLVGMRERVRLYGGDLQAGSLRGGGFTVRARLPFEGGVR